MPFTDPMADGPSIQAAGLRALKAGMTLKKTLAMVRDFRKGDNATPLVLMGYYNPIYIYGVDKFLADAKSAGRRRPDHRRPAAGRRHRAVPAGDEGRAQLHPAGDADHRRQAAAGGARQHLGLCLLRLDHRHHRRAQRPIPAPSARPSPGSSGIPACRSASASASARRTPPAPSPRTPTAPWSAPRWSMPCAAASMRRAAPPPKPSARSPISWRRWRRACGAPSRPRNRPHLREDTPRRRLAGRRPRRHISSQRPQFGANHELAHQRRPAEDPQHPAPRDAGESVDQVPGFRAARVLQGRRGQPVRDPRLELPHAHGRGGAAEVDLRQRDLVRHRAARGHRRSAEIPRRAPLRRPHQGCRAPAPA